MRHCFYWLIILSLLPSAKGQFSATSGVVVQSQRNSPGEKNGGLQKGDVILTVSTTANHVWKVESPLTLEWATSERGGQDAIILRGIRNGKSCTWIVKTQNWEIATVPRRPEFSSLHETIDELRQAKRFDDIIHTYEQLPTSFSRYPDLKIWTLVDAARWFMAAHDQTRAGQLFAEAMTISRSATPIAQSRMLTSYAMLLLQSRDFERAKAVLQNALRINATLSPYGRICQD